MTTDKAEYNVWCEHCDAVFQPPVGSALWWQAKQRAEKGFLDAIYVSGVRHGCVTFRETREPEAPYRVFGYDCFLEDYDIPCQNFIEAVKIFKAKCQCCLDVVFISGVSPAVRDRLTT